MRWYQHRYHSPLSLRIVFGTIPRLPRWSHPPIAVVTAAIFFCLLRAERRAVLRNLAVVTGRSGWRLWGSVYRVFYNFCDFVVSYCYVPRASHQELLAMLSHPDRGEAIIEAALGGGRGLVVWTAHVANWEFASRLLELHGRPVKVARVVERDNPAERQLRDLMTNERLTAIDLLDPLASIRLLHALRAGEIVAMQGDRVFRGKGLVAPFFGRPTVFPPGPFHLAHAAGVAVVPGLVARTGWLRYRMIVGEPLPLDHAKDRDAAVGEALASGVSFLEAHLRRWHCQWLNFYDFWPADRVEPAAPEAAPDRAGSPRASCTDPSQSR